MNIKFPFSTSYNTRQTWHSFEFRRLLVSDFVLDSLIRGSAVSIYASHHESFEGIEELKELVVEQHASSINLEEGLFRYLKEISKDIIEVLYAVGNSDKALFGKQKFWELASLYHANKLDNSTNILNKQLGDIEFSFSVDDYKSCKKDIETAAQLYTESLCYQLSKSDIKANSFIQEGDEQVPAAKKYLDSFHQRAIDIRDKLSAFFTSFTVSRKQPFQEVAEMLTQKLDLWTEMEENFGFNPKENYIQEVNTLLEKLCSLSNAKSTSAIAHNPKAYAEQVQRLRHNYEEVVRRECLMLNGRNAGDGEITNLEIDLASLLKDINNCQLFKEEISIHTLSLSLKLDAVHQLIKQLENGIYELGVSGEMAAWLNFQAGLSTAAQAIIDVLCAEEVSRWQGIYDSWFLEKMLLQNGMMTQEIIFGKLSAIRENWDNIRFDFVDIAHSLIQDKKLDFQILPITALDEHEKGDVVVLGDVSEQLWDDLRSNGRKVLGLKPKENRTFSQQDFLHESLLAAYENEDELEIKLLRSKFLATYLLQDSEQLELFLAPDGNVIIDSTYADVVDLVKSKLMNYKQVKMRDNGFKVLTEFFLNEAEHNYYYYDQTSLRFETAEDIYQHNSKIRSFQLAGYYTIAINRNQLNNPSYISTIMEVDKIRNA